MAVHDEWRFSNLAMVLAALIARIREKGLTIVSLKHAVRTSLALDDADETHLR